jgi:hypothetical protein
MAAKAAIRVAPKRRNPCQRLGGQAARMLASASMTSVKGAALAGLIKRPRARTASASER